jgi:hypothetical protein
VNFEQTIKLIETAEERLRQTSTLLQDVEQTLASDINFYAERGLASGSLHHLHDTLLTLRNLRGRLETSAEELVETVND